MGAFRLIDAARVLTAATVVVLAGAFASEAPAAEGPALPPAEYKPLPVGTRIEYDNVTVTVTKQENFTTVLKKQVRNSAAWVVVHALFGEYGDDIYAKYARNEPIAYDLDEDNKKKLEVLWPLTVGKQTTYQLNEARLYYSEAQVWTITLKVTGTETFETAGRIYQTYVVEERGESDGGMSFSGRKWYHPASGLIVRSRRVGTGRDIFGDAQFAKIAHLAADKIETSSLRMADFPPGTAAEVVSAARGTATAALGKTAPAEMEGLKREAQEVRRALEEMKARQAEEQKAREAKLAQLDREIEEWRKTGAQQTDKGARELKEREAEIARLRKEAEERKRAEEARQAQVAAEAKAREAEIARRLKEANEAQRSREAEIAKLKQEAEQARKAREAEIAKLKQEAEQALKAREAEMARLRLTLAERRDDKGGDAGPSLGGIDFGRYHALVIGIDNYKHLPKLNTAVNDARAVAEVLEKDYGFTVTLLTDPDRRDIINALDIYRETLGRNDNLLIYYAGHGWLDREVDRGYWLPMDAEPRRRSEWVSNATITDTLKALSAKHVMVVADSCYSGTLVRGADMGTRTRTGDYWKQMATKVARVAITSGGLEPVADAGGGNYSPFAKAFIDVLGGNASVMDGTQLFSQMRRPVMVNARQTPQYADVREAGHDGGDFLFVRKKK